MNDQCMSKLGEFGDLAGAQDTHEHKGLDIVPLRHWISDAIGYGLYRYELG